MDIKPLESEADYQRALKQVEYFFDHVPQKGTRDGVIFETLVDLVEAYEGKEWSKKDPTPAEMLQFFMEHNNLQQKDLAHLLHSSSLASEILSGKREPSKDIIVKIENAWGLPAGCLISNSKSQAA